MGVFANSGQICFAGTRVLVQRPIVDEFTERLLAFMDTLQVGHSLDAAATMGPVISNPNWTKCCPTSTSVEREGAELLRGGQRLGGEFENGYFVQPSVFGGVTNQMRIAREEIFGPFCQSCRSTTSTKPSPSPTTVNTGSVERCGHRISPPLSGRSMASTQGPCG